VLWKSLIDEWRISPHEIAYIDRQQGLHCTSCRCSLRSMALAAAIMASYGFVGLFEEFVHSDTGKQLQVLEINEAGGLTPFLERMPARVLASYPAVDMTALPYEDASFDLVIHSDTLEHVPHPVRGLSECRRVLKPGGFCAFTIPIIVDRLTASREGMPPSYHGSPDCPSDCLVQTEYGADAWKHAALAGFRECRLFFFDYPSAMALVGVC
jgi:SAM-dependent methyltransferase